jgi:branched-chain amino acid transport system substrate-binding protein
MIRKTMTISKFFVVVTIFVILTGGFFCSKQDKKEIHVLAILPLTGPASTLGNYVKNGFTLFKDDFPQTEIKINYLDSEGNPAKAVSMLNQSIMKERPDIVVSALSNVSGSIIPKTEMEKIFTIITLTTSQGIIKGRGNVQRINPSAEDIVGPIARLAKKRFKKIAVLYSNEEFGLSNKKIFSSIFVDADHEIIIDEAYAIIEKDVKTLVQKIINTQPEAIYVTGYGPAYIAIFQTIKTMNYMGKVLADTPIGDPFVMNVLGDAAEGILFSGTEIELSNPNNDNALKFIEKYKVKFGKLPYFNSVFAYDLMKILDKCAKEKIEFSQENFAKLEKWEGVVTVIKFIGSGECEIPLIPILRKDGRNIFVQ